MELSPQVIANATFPVVKRGYDPDGVRTFLADVSQAYDDVAHRAAAMESRARAAVAKVHELQRAAKAGGELSTDDAETISRTLLLAQKAADATLAEARTEADAVLAAAQAEARRTISEAEVEAERLAAEARADVRRQVEAERLAAQGEVQALLARRNFLVSDVDALERHVADQRRRLLEIADLLTQVAHQAPGGLGEARRPLMSAAGDDHAPLLVDAPAPALESPAEAAVDVPADLWDDIDMDDDGPLIVLDHPDDVPEDIADHAGLAGTVTSNAADLGYAPIALELDPTPHDQPGLLDFDRLDGSSS